MTTHHTIIKLAATEKAKSWASRPYRIHQRLSMMWPDGDKDSRMLWRLYPDRVLVQTIEPPPLISRSMDEPGLFEGRPVCKEVDMEPHEGAVYWFDIVCAPSYSTTRNSGGLRDLANVGCWWGQKSASLGLQTLEIEVLDARMSHIPEAKKSPGPIRFSAVQIRGRAICKDSKMLDEAIVKGVGREKAFGCGLLLVHPVS